MQGSGEEFKEEGGSKSRGVAVDSPHRYDRDSTGSIAKRNTNYYVANVTFTFFSRVVLQTAQYRYPQVQYMAYNP